MESKELVSYIVKALVDYPDEVNIKEVEGGRSIILELNVKQEDIGKVIGKNGRIARAIRTIIGAAATKSGRRVLLEIIDQKTDGA